ncbi:GlcG/HbpS family heme-binding protein [Hwanghaeella sp.]|uniref:GlcG/HbpS family heme-binding protein n=1 Tax=Hwanghaeella sp. TaxID=2605943 RepID=UPI003CCC0027
MTIKLDTARSMIDSILSDARAKDMPPMTACVVDAAGDIVAMSREDGASPLRPKIAHGKANGAIAMGIGSRALFERAQQQPYFIQAMNALSDGALVPVPGGVLVKQDGRIIGAVGITGASSDDDEALAVAAIEKAGLQADCG